MKERILEIMKISGVTAWKFAEIIGVQASSISHILSGRNQPSLEFAKKILVKYPDISIEWLILGQGDMYKAATPPSALPLDDETNTAASDEYLFEVEGVESLDENVQQDVQDITNVNPTKLENIPSEKEQTVTDVNNNTTPQNRAYNDISAIFDDAEEIEKIVIFYKSKSFAVYKNI